MVLGYWKRRGRVWWILRREMEKVWVWESSGIAALLRDVKDLSSSTLTVLFSLEMEG